MYRFQLVSDLHIEFGVINRVQRFANNLLLAGDIGYPETPAFKEYLQYCSQTFDKVFYVPGNHEYYQLWKKTGAFQTIDELNQVIDRVFGEIGSNLINLNNRSYDYDPNLKIVGTTLWSHIRQDAMKINDSYQIFKAPLENITFEDTNRMHSESVRFLEGEITKAKIDGKRLLVMTHHLPSYQLILEKYRDKKYAKMNCHFYSDLDHLITSPVVAWCAGHSHGFNHQVINGVQTFVNAYGYPNENRNGSSLDFNFWFS